MRYSPLVLTLIIFMIVSCNSEQKQEVVEIKSKSLPKPILVDSFYCYAKGILFEWNNIKFQFDKVEFLKSDMAKKAMVEDGLISNNEMPPNDFYLRNKDEEIETALIDSNIVIIMQTHSYDADGNFKINERISLDELRILLSPNYERNYINYPFEIKLENSKITQITEKYIP